MNIKFLPGAFKAYLQFFAGVLFIFLGLNGTSVYEVTTGFIAAYLFLEKAFS